MNLSVSLQYMVKLWKKKKKKKKMVKAIENTGKTIPSLVKANTSPRVENPIELNVP